MELADRRRDRRSERIGGGGDRRADPQMGRHLVGNREAYLDPADVREAESDGARRDQVADLDRAREYEGVHGRPERGVAERDPSGREEGFRGVDGSARAVGPRLGRIVISLWDDLRGEQVPRPIVVEPGLHGSRASRLQCSARFGGGLAIVLLPDVRQHRPAVDPIARLHGPGPAVGVANAEEGGGVTRGLERELDLRFWSNGAGVAKLLVRVRGCLDSSRAHRDRGSYVGVRLVAGKSAQSGGSEQRHVADGHVRPLRAPGSLNRCTYTYLGCAEVFGDFLRVPRYVRTTAKRRASRWWRSRACVAPNRSRTRFSLFSQSGNAFSMAR